MAKIDKSNLVLTGRGRKKRWRKRDTATTTLLGAIGGIAGYEGRNQYINSKKYNSARKINENKKNINETMKSIRELRKTKQRFANSAAREKSASNLMLELEKFRLLNEESDSLANQIKRLQTTKFKPKVAAGLGVAAGTSLGVALYAKRKVNQEKYNDINNKKKKQRSFSSYSEAFNHLLGEKYACDS